MSVSERPKGKIHRFFGKVLPDGRIALPVEIGMDVGKVYEVILIPREAQTLYAFAEELAKEKGFQGLSDEELEKIIHESRGGERS